MKLASLLLVLTLTGCSALGPWPSKWDVNQALTDTMKATAKEFAERSNKGPVSPIYCDIKRKLIIQQADIIAKTVQGRF